jgi:hypothetical protein
VERRTRIRDSTDLKRSIALSFSTGELSKFAERFGVMLDREGPVDGAARSLIRAIEAAGKVDLLMSALRSHKPLMEWPDPPMEPVPSGPGSGTGLAIASEPAAPAKVASPSQPAERDDDKAHDDPYEFEPAPAAARPTLTREPWFWPAVGAAAFVLGISMGGVVVWRLTRSDTPAPPASGLGAAAHDVLTSSVETVVQACGAETTSQSAREKLTEAFRRCTQPDIRPGLDPGLIPAPPSPRPAEPPPAAQQGGPAAPREPACLDICHRMHNECKSSECGSEPAAGSAYGNWQRCLQGCLQKYSRCRLGCH